MKRTIIIILIAVSLVIVSAAAWLATQWYGVIEVVSDVAVIYNDREAFVFVSHEKSALAESRFMIIAKRMTSGLLVPEPVSDDLLVAHLSDGQLAKRDLVGFGLGGGPQSFRGQVYWGRGQEHPGQTRTWRWNGTDLIPMSEADTDKLYSQFKDIDDATHEAGYFATNFTPGYPTPETTAHLREGDVKVYADVRPGFGGVPSQTRVFLMQSKGASSPEMLIAIPNGYQALSRKEYLKLKVEREVKP